MILFEFNAVASKPFIEVISAGDNGEGHAQTMIKLEDTSNDAVLKTCQSWMDAFGLSDVEYKVNVRLH